MDLAWGRAVARVLLILRGPITTEAVRELWEAEARGPDSQHAVCWELPAGQDGVHEALRAQRALTEALREACGHHAENIAVFAASEREGERLEDYARAWGATFVRP